MKLVIILIFLTFSLCSINAQNSESDSQNDSRKSWIIKARLIPSSTLGSFGLGMEKQVDSKLSVLCLVNYFSVRFGSDSPTYSGISVAPELRYHFKGFSNRSFFVSKFFEVGERSNSRAGEIDINNYTHNMGGSFIGGGFLMGKNMSIGKKFHIDTYLGPRYRWQNETIVETISSEETESNRNILKWGLRFGINLNFNFN